MSTALKIEYWGHDSGSFAKVGEVEFDEEEAQYIKLIPNIQTVVQTSQNQAPKIVDISRFYDEGASAYNHKKMDITFRLKTTTTKDNIETLLNYDNFRIYYRYNESPSTSIDCFLDKNYTESLQFGEISQDTVTLTFYQILALSSPLAATLCPEYYVDVIIDPDGLNLRLDGLHDVDKISPIINRIDIDPQNLGNLQIMDVLLQFKDYHEFFNLISDRVGAYKPFKYIWNVIDSVSGNQYTLRRYGQGALDAYVNEGERFQADDKVTFYNGTNSEETYVVSISNTEIATGGTPANYLHQIITVPSGALSHTYSAGDVVISTPLHNLDVDIKVRQRFTNMRDSVTTTTIFKGIIKEPFQWKDGIGILKIKSKIGEELSQEIKYIASGAYDQLHNAVYMDSDGSSTDAYVITSAAGTINDLYIFIYNGASLGKWTITFTDANNFVVTGPGVKEDSGDITHIYQDGSGGSDSQIEIGASAWGGTWAGGDTLEIYISRLYLAQTVYAAFNNFLSDYLSAPTVTGINNLYKVVWDSDNVNVCFDKAIIIGEAINTILMHALAYLAVYPANEGYGVFCLWPYTYDTANNRIMETGMGDISKSAEPSRQSMSIKSTDIYNEITIKYAWHPTNKEYQFDYTYPEPNTTNYSEQIFGFKRSVTIEIPFYYDSTAVERWAKRIWSIWAFGIYEVLVMDEDVNTPIGSRVINHPFLNDFPDKMAVVKETKHYLTERPRTEATAVMLPLDVFKFWWD